VRANDRTAAGAAYLNLFVAALFVVPTIVTGLLAWQFVLEGAKLRSLLLLHLIAGSCAGLLIIVSWWLHWRARKSAALTLSRYRIPVELIGPSSRTPWSRVAWSTPTAGWGISR